MEGHDLDEDGEHDEDACYSCLLQKEVPGDCRCGKCCRLLIEVEVRDADQEPRIMEEGSPIYADPRTTASGERELIGCLLNSAKNQYACAFLDLETNLCNIHPTRPLCCRLFDCEGEGRDQLVELGLLPRER